MYEGEKKVIMDTQKETISLYSDEFYEREDWRRVKDVICPKCNTQQYVLTEYREIPGPDGCPYSCRFECLNCNEESQEFDTIDQAMLWYAGNNKDQLKLFEEE